MSGGQRKARIHFIICLLTIILGMLALSEANSQNVSSTNVRRSNAELVSPASAPAGAYFDHVVIIVMENEGVYNICNSSPPPCSTTGPAPYMAGLANNYTIAAQYLSLITTSQPNYVGLLSGSMQGCTSSGCPSPITAPNLVDRFEASGLTWKGYFENQTLPRGCDFNSPEPYTAIHNPFIVFQDITNNTARCNKLVNVNPNSCGSVIDCTLVNDLNNATAPASNFMWLTPNDCDNMRGNAVCGTSSLIGPGNAYLSKLVPTILNSRTFTTTRSALFITFDEGNSFCPGPFPSTEDCVYASWSGPVTKTHFGTGNLYNHYSFTKTIETNWNLASLTPNDQNANPMAEFFNNQAPDFTVSASPARLTTPVGSHANSTITLASINSFTGTIALTASSSPTGPSLTLNPTSIPLSAQGTGTSTLTFSSATIGNYTVTVIGTRSPLSHNTTITFNVAAPDFVISANPSSLAIGQLSSVAGTPVVVNSTGDRTFFESSYLAQSFYAKGLIWLFYEDSRFTCEHQTGCLTYTTSTNGSRWAPASRVPIHVTDNDFSVYTDGASVFYARYNETSFESTCGKQIQFGLGTLNISGTIAWQPEQTVAVGAANRDYPNDEITVDSNGQVWIAYMIDNHTACGGDGTDRPQVIHSAGTNYAVWTGNFTLSTAHSNNWHIALASLGNGQIYSSYWLRNADLHGRLYNGTSWGPDEQISSTTTKNDINAWLFNSGTSVYAIYFDNSTEKFNFASRSSLGVWTISTIGIGESHTGTLAFSPSYYSLPDSASYDAKDNLFDLFYLNATAQRIDQWSGSANKWTKTTGLLSIAAAPYPDSISSFIRSFPNAIGSIFYITGSASPFTISSAALSFKPASNTGAFTVNVTGKNGFTGTVNLATSVTPSTGLSVSCSPTSITGGSGSSSCNLVSSAQGNYTVTVTGTSGSLSHLATVAVSVTSSPDFSILGSSPAQANVGQSPTSTITITALNGFTGVVSLTDTIPTGLSCNTISPNTITSSGTATVSCTATVAGNYTLTVTGTSGSLSHSTTALFRFQDFTTSATSPVPVDATQPAASTITIAALNHFSGIVNLSDAIPSGLTCGPITPTTLTGSGTATVSCSANIAGNYTLTITGSSGSLSHSATAVLRFQDFTVAATSPSGVNAGQSPTSTVTVAAVNGFAGTITFTNTPSPGLTCGSFSPTSVTGSGSATISCTAAVAGNYTATITGTSTPLSHNATATFQFRDFTIAAASPAPANAGSSASSTITLVAINHFTGVIILTDTVPSGLACGTIAPTSITGSGTATVSCSATIAGNYTLTVTATSGSLAHSAVALFQLRDFTITSTLPTPANVGVSTTSTITITALNHFSGTVSISDTVPPGLICGTISPTSVAGSGTATISCHAGLSGNYTLTLTGTSDLIIHTSTAIFQFWDFNASASSPPPVNAGTPAVSTITITAANHFNGVVSLTDSAPSGLVCGAISPTSITGSGIATVSCNSILAGNYTLTVTGTSSSLVHNATVLFQFRDFGIVASTPNAINSGSSTTSTITISSINRFTGTVSLTDIVPSGLSCGVINPTSINGAGTATISCSANVAGNYTLTVTGSSGSLNHEATTIIRFVDYTITATTPPATTSGSSVTITITVTSLNKFAGIVSLNDTIPIGVLCTAINPGSVTGSGSAAVSCASNIAGNYTLTFTGTNSALLHSATVVLSVQDYAITADLTSVKINARSSGSSIITITPLNHFSGTVSFSVSGTTGLNPAINPTSLIGGSGTATLTFSSNTAGNYNATITSSSGTLTHTITVSVQVVDFALTASPTTITLLARTTGNSTVTINGLNGFIATVSLTVTPSTGLIAATVPTSILGSGSSILTVSAPVYGNYSVTIQATSGSLSHTIGITIHVVDYRIDANPVNLVDPAGSNTSSTLTLHSLNGYAGNVSLTFTVQADSATSAPGGSLGGPHPLLFIPPAVLPTVSVNPLSSHLSPGGTELSIVSVSLPSNLPVGTYRIIMTADDGTLSHTIVLTIVATDFSITATPTSASISTGSNATITLNFESLSFFQGNVNLTITSTPGGPTGILSASIVQLTFYSKMNLNLTIQVPSNTPIGNYTITIQAASGTATHTLSIAVRVTTGGLLSMLAQILSRQNSGSISAIAIFSLLAIFATLSVRRYPKQKSIFQTTK